MPVSEFLYTQQGAENEIQGYIGVHVGGQQLWSQNAGGIPLWGYLYKHTWSWTTAKNVWYFQWTDKV